MTWRPCIACGEPSEQSRCAEHRPVEPPKAASTARGYDTTWRHLSERARRAQPFCTDCGTRDDLTTDHTTEAWQARAAGRPITLAMVDVVCRSCNAKRGRARPGEVPPTGMVPDPSGKAESRSHTGSQMGGAA